MIQSDVHRTGGGIAKAIDASSSAETHSDNWAGGHVRPHKICLFGMFGGGNFGNDASLESFLLFLREARPDADISCVCVDPDAIGQEHQIATAPISAPEFSNAFLRFSNKVSLRMIGRLANWHRAIKHVRQFDIVIVPGTSTLNDYGSGPFGTSYGLFRWAAAARLCGVKFCFVGTGAGPILHPISRWMLRSAAAWAHFRSFRDQVSKDFLKSLGIDTSNDQVHPDLVFKMPTPLLPVRDAQEKLVTIGVGLMNHNGWRAGSRSASDPTVYQTYIEKMGRFVNSLLDRGYRVRLLTGETVDTRAVRDIGRIAKANGYELIDGILPPRKAQQLIVEPINSLHDVMRQIGDTDIVVATRFHNVVCALKLARPTISVGYEAKNDAVMTDFGLGEFCQSIESLDLDVLETQLAELLKNKEHYQAIIRQNLDAMQLRVKRHEQELLSKIL
jgi:polysaccharide pyruvyl transferase WcaK-like protein